MGIWAGAAAAAGAGGAGSVVDVGGIGIVVGSGVTDPGGPLGAALYTEGRSEGIDMIPATAAVTAVVDPAAVVEVDGNTWATEKDEDDGMPAVVPTNADPTIPAAALVAMASCFTLPEKKGREKKKTQIDRFHH